MWSPVCDVFDEKAKINKNLSAKYIVKEHSALVNDGNDLFYVYAHYPTTEPDVMVMAFVSRANAELFCEALNAENERREADVVKHGHWIEEKCSVCMGEAQSQCGYMYFAFCSRCGAKMDGESNG